MAHTINTTTLLNGPRHIIVHVFIESDGASADLVDEILIDPVDFGLENNPGVLSLEELMYTLSGFSAKLEFDTGLVTDELVWVLAPNETACIDFNPFGGFVDNSGLDGTGKLQISTTSLATAGSKGSLILKLRKKG